MTKRRIATFGGIGIAAVFGLILLLGGIGHNDDQNWQIKQSVFGNVTVRNAPGYYVKAFATVWTWPKSHQVHYSAHVEEGGVEDRSIQVTFNDSGTAQVSTLVRFRLPPTQEQRRFIHQEFSGDIDLVTQAVRAHLINCIKAAGPLMSSSEHQSSRKAEFTMLVNEMLSKGLYRMRRIEKSLPDVLDEHGRPTVVLATEIITDKDGVPMIAEESPLTSYGIEVSQFSVTGTVYDAQTLEQFAAKKASFLATELGKAKVAEETQQRLMVIEKGKRELAEIEAEANKVKMKATVEAQQKVDVAELEKEQSVVEALKLVEVAEQKKAEEAVNLQIAELVKQQAVEEAEAIKTLAAAEEEKIMKAGAITEKEKVLAEIAKERDAAVAAALSKINVPSVMFNGSGDGEGSANNNENLMNLLLLRGLGILDIEKETTNE